MFIIISIIVSIIFLFDGIIYHLVPHKFRRIYGWKRYLPLSGYYMYWRYYVIVLKNPLLNNDFDKQFEELERLIIMRLSPNEAYSSGQMDKMIDDKIKSIITKYQEEP